MPLEELIKKYAKLIVDFGVNVRKNHYLVVQADVACNQVVKHIAYYAFKRGVKDVIVHYSDVEVDFYRGSNVAAAQLQQLLPWQKDSLLHYFEAGADAIILRNVYPTKLSSLSEENANALSIQANAYRNILRESVTLRGSHWCVVDVPNQEWASHLFPDLGADEALDKLWHTLLGICKIDKETDPVANWHADRRKFWAQKVTLDQMKIDSIRFTNRLGTDITVGLVPESRWTCGIESVDFDEGVYLPNIPTAELATSPDKYRTNGVVVSTKPVVVGGKLIDEFTLTFKDGRVVDYKANIGKSLLEALLKVDEASSYLGEVALVCKTSAIAQSGLLFYSTLFDENAACHLAIGKGFPQCIAEFDSSIVNEWEKHHLNNSAIHVDFMFGSDDLSAVATTVTGEQITLMVDGKLVL